MVNQPDLRELYQELILDHSKKPRNFKELEHANHTAEGFNPLCGDRVKLYVALDGAVIKDIGFQGSGCAISSASASMMTTAVKGKTKEQAQELFNAMLSMVSGTQDAEINREKLGNLSVFSGVSEYPVRVKCATLPWHTLKAGLENTGKTVSTE